MKTLKEFNNEIYQNIYYMYFNKLKDNALEIQKQEVEETINIYNLVLSVLEQLHVGNFDLRYFYKDIINKRDENIHIIDKMVSNYEKVNYIKINELYNEWRIIIHKIGKYIGESLEQYLNQIQKENIYNAEIEDAQKEFGDLENLEKILDKI